MIAGLLVAAGALLAGSQAVSETPWGLGVVIGLALVVTGVNRLDRRPA